jgi:hypothetical protein
MKHSHWIFKGALIAILGLVFCTNTAQASQLTGQPFPVFTDDGNGYGSEQYQTVFAYYGGTEFTPETTFQANAFMIRACSNATTSLPVQVFYNIYDITSLATTTGEYSNFTLVTTVAGSIDSCSFGLADVFVNHSYDFDPTLYTFTIGHKYMVTPQSFGTNYDAVWSNIQYAISNAPADNIATCFIDFLCSGFFKKVNHSTLFISFSQTGQPATVSTCFLSAFPFIDLFQCVKDTFVFLLVPSPTTFDNFSTLKDDIKNKAPFGYLTSAITTISAISSSSSPTFALATSSPIMTYIFDPLRAGLGWVVYFGGLVWLYKRLTHIDI